jgi:predicted Mrr-cat superfamily restriction endonuclease
MVLINAPLPGRPLLSDSYGRRMPALWGIHNDQSSLDLVKGGFVSIGWEEIGDLRILDTSREGLKLRLAQTYPTAKPGQSQSGRASSCAS